MSEPLIEPLLKNSIITFEEFRKAIEEQQLNGDRLESILVRLGYIKEEDLISFLCDLYRVPFFKFSQFEIKPDIIKLIPYDCARKYQVIPIHKVRFSLTLAMVDPSDIDVIDKIRSLTGMDVEPVGASEREIIKAIKKYYEEESETAGE